MVSRILSTLLLWAAVLGSLWLFGPHAAVAIITLLAALTLHEFYQLTEKIGFRPFRWMALGFSILITAGPYCLITEDFFSGEEFGGFAPALLALALVASCIRCLGERDPTNRIESVFATVIGLVYVPFMLHFLVRLMLLYDEPTMGLVVTLWAVGVSKFCDVGALLSGLAFGKHQMSPNISPKKTWEGAIGGVLISAGVGAGLAWWAADCLPDGFTPLTAALVALPLAMVTFVSDLMESAMKRRADIKDTGKLIPGIGGAFDLTDSLILTAPVAYVIFLFLS